MKYFPDVLEDSSTAIGYDSYRLVEEATPIICHQQALSGRTGINWDRYPRAARKWWRGEGGTGVWWGDL